MRCEDQQIPAPGAPGRLRGGLPGAATASAQVQPQEVHPAPAPGLPGAQRVRAPRLPRAGRPSGRSPRPLPANRPEGRAPLHDLPEGRPAAPGRCPRPEDVRRRAPAGAAGPGAQPPHPPGGHRRHGAGVAPRQPLFRQAEGRRGPQRRQDLRPLPEGRLRGRLQEPHDPRGGPRPGTGQRPGAVRPGVESGGAPRPHRGAPGRRRLRRRVAAPRGPLARRAHDHPACAGPALRQAAGGALAAGDETAVRQAEAQVRPALAGGVRELDDQAAARLGTAGAAVRQPGPRDHPEGHNA